MSAREKHRAHLTKGGIVKLSVTIAVTEKVAYDTKDIATCKLEVEHTDTSPRALRSAVEALTEDVGERIATQLRAVEKAQALAAREAEDAADAVPAF